MRWLISCILLGSSMVTLAADSAMAESLHLDWIDSSIPLQDNFYLFANGTWKKDNPIPPDYGSWGSFSILQKKNREAIHEMLMQVSQNPHLKPGSVEQKVGDFYFSGMDETTINRLGLAPLQSEFDKIAAIHDLESLQAMLAHLHTMGIGVLFSLASMHDFKDSSQVIASVAQGGLSLPNRDYYLKSTENFKAIRETYLKHVAKMFELMGDAPHVAAEEAKTVMRIETALAKASMSQVEQRDPYAVYHKMDLAQLKQLTPHFSWPNYLHAMSLSDIQTMNVEVPAFMQVVDQAFQSTPLEDWKTYLRWHLLSESSPYLSKPFLQQNFSMLQAITGVESLPERWKQVLSTEDTVLGFGVGALYVKKYFSEDTKRDVLAMIKNISEVLNRDLAELSWMAPETRQAAIHKLNMLEKRVGYPDKWRDYSALNIDRGPYILNVLRGSAFLVRRDLNKIGKPIDRTEWEMTPQTVNAYYDPSMNSINIPIGILQPPYYDPKAPASVNYGAIGAVIGHEITHGFDDQGSQFDAKGNLHDWWKPEDAKKFHAATQCIVNQFSQYTVDGGIPVQGKLVVGEATADLGGLILAYRAYHATDAYQNAPTIEGYTPDQQFFLSYAHVWANNMRPQQALNLITVDPHPPTMYRVNGTVANMEQFQTAFQIPLKSPMVKAPRCMIW